MKREIKFRVFIHGKMLYDIFPTGDSTYGFWHELKGEANFIASGNTITNMMQFTGLKDKNGTEIYEGDILKESDTGIFEVVWQSTWCKFALDHTRVCKFIQYPGWNRGENMVVIGNIHENKDLLS